MWVIPDVIQVVVILTTESPPKTLLNGIPHKLCLSCNVIQLRQWPFCFSCFKIMHIGLAQQASMDAGLGSPIVTVAAYSPLRSP